MNSVTHTKCAPSFTEPHALLRQIFLSPRLCGYDCGKIAQYCVAGTRSLGCVHKVRALTPGTLRLVLNNFSQSSIARCDCGKIRRSRVVRTCEFSHNCRGGYHPPAKSAQSSIVRCDAEKSLLTALPRSLSRSCRGGYHPPAKSARFSIVRCDCGKIRWSLVVRTCEFSRSCRDGDHPPAKSAQSSIVRCDAEKSLGTIRLETVT